VIGSEAGHRVNTYHLLHVRRLAQLVAWHHDKCRWAGYSPSA
jgi:hypothetical protein